ncbi:MAG: restriction endonuclease [Bacillota bacterium]
MSQKEIDIEKAYYIKLGHKGAWEQSSIEEGKIRIGWTNAPLRDIQLKRWEAIEDIVVSDCATIPAGKNDFLALQNIINADEKTVFITFYGGRLYWCTALNTEEIVYKDEISKYRIVNGQWQCKNVNGDILDLWRVSGKVTKLQRFPATCCKVHELEYLKRLLNGLVSKEYEEIKLAQEKLIGKVEEGIKLLHPKEFELLVELIFRQSGWRRISVLGEIMKDIDLELEDPITHDLYMVQVKSESNKKEFEKYTRLFKQLYQDKYRKFYYVVHSTSGCKFESEDKNIELLYPGKLSQMVVSLGLLDWLMNKIR